MKINFTKEHFQRMQILLMQMLLNSETIPTKLGTPLNVTELLHNTTINTLNGIRLSLSRQIENLENADEWVAPRDTQTKLEGLKAHKELVNLIIGYKRYQLEVAETQKKRKELQSRITEMKEAAKTPEDRLKEAEAELAALDEVPDFN